MNDLELSRKEICRIDEEMAHLFEERMQVCRTIAAYKKERGLSIRDAARETELIAKNKTYIQDSDVASYYGAFLRSVIDLSCQFQTRLMQGPRVAYCGVKGAFSYLAAKRMFPGGELAAFPGFTEAYQAAECGECDCAVLPLENSYAGEVGTVMDLLFTGGLYINQVIDLPVIHDLIAVPGTDISQIQTVVSHPQALHQCAGFLQRHGFRTEECTNTALAAKLVLERKDPTIAAIASEEAAALLGLTVLEHAINDSGSNTTRFACLSRAQNRPVTTRRREDENFILVFTVQNEAGALAQTLNIIGAHGFNMRSLRSRPRKDLQWRYFFYIEAEGNINTENGRDMLQELSAICAKLRLVGTYYANNIGGV